MKPRGATKPGRRPAAKRASVDDALALAIAHHRSNGLDKAETLYRRILAAVPAHAGALHFLGVLTHQRGRSEAALELIRRSIALGGAPADWHNNLGNVLLETGRVDEAAAAYEEAARLAPGRADIHNNLGVLRRAQKRPQDAEVAYRRAIEIDPAFVDAHANLGTLLHALGRDAEAVQAWCQALVLKPHHGPARRGLGMAYYLLGRFDEAARVYRDWLDEEPGHPEALHHLAACTGEAVPQRASDAYVETVFDGFAESFDAKLAMLQYRAPELIAQALPPLLGEPRAALRVLDAGCGTGLCGPLLAPYASHLHGVDLSAGMLARAEPRQVYDALTKAELTAFLADAAGQPYDLIVSADTLCYFGDLGAVTRAAAGALRAGGWLVFTVEALAADPADPQDGEGAGFHLQPHGRYSHAEHYLRQVLGQAGLQAHGLQPVHLRTEGAKPVEGFVVSARAPAPGAAHNESTEAPR